MFARFFYVLKQLAYLSICVMEITLYITNLNCVFKFTFI